MENVQKSYKDSPQDSPSIETIDPASLLEANIKAGVTDENHLRSLGLIMEDGKPRFKLDEPVTGQTDLSMSGSGLTNFPSAPITQDQDEESFIVFGSDSLNSIQASSMASYIQIQQKSMSTDYSSLISSLSIEETQKKIKELLQENVKLKETLKQNNLAMKQQFNVLAAWQEEIMKVHQSHKQKFSETKALINQLRKENAELKVKASKDSVPSNINDSKIEDLEIQLQTTLLSQKSLQPPREVELEAANSKLVKELNDTKTVCYRLTAEVEHYTALSKHLSQQLKHAKLTIEELNLDLEKLQLNLKEKEELASLADFSIISMSEQTKPSKPWKDKIIEQEKEIEHLRGLINSLECQLNVSSQNTFAPIEIRTRDSSHPPSPDHVQFNENVKQYNETLVRLSELYAKYATRYINVQECLKELIELLQDLEQPEKKEGLGVNEQEKRDKLRSCQARLTKERQAMINERQELTKAQSQFQKIFSDFNSLLYELEILHEENDKLSSLRDNNASVAVTQESPQKSAVDDEQNLAKERLLLEAMKASILQEQKDLNEEKKAINALKEKCQKQDQEEVIKLQEAIKHLQNRNVYLEKCRTTDKETFELLNLEIKSLKSEAEKHPLLLAQVKIYETDFKEEREARERLSAENEKLIHELKKMRQMQVDLVENLEGRSSPRSQQQQSRHQQQQQQQQQSVTASGGEHREEDSDYLPTSVITAFSCPKCSLSFRALRPLQEHVEACLDLQ
ncbi:optineurin isoform X1 [Neodiprion lecontei]|uniref:Optineurin isoform X1 n=2 Tax=Neodiprion lecontei TaxID=441921 RepID=A0A6J0CBV4_NEOLC|nr:optineurin isoform X1 [Neodiprion lecontei]XP_015524153.2 optineurin isoform X1 [Neodiprion lecontei]